MKNLFVDIPDLDGRLFVVGDLHGCAHELEVLLGYLNGDFKLQPDDYVIFLGDYIDRGPNSRRVVQLLIDFKRQHANTVFLKGNHEDMLLDYLGFEGRLGEGYLSNGGAEALESYGIGVDTPPLEVRKLLPEDHLQFYRSLERLAIHPRFVFVHAGVNPGIPLEWQYSVDLFWIRESFIDYAHEFSQTVLFGHTPFVKVYFDLPFKIGIDTGLVYGNMLSCIELKQGLLYQIRRGSSEILVSSIV